MSDYGRIGSADPATTSGRELDANARLIAAAPELHRDLETALALVRIKYGNLDKDVNEFLARADATLAKVRGRVSA
jgi:hypothetical protein